MSSMRGYKQTCNKEIKSELKKVRAYVSFIKACEVSNIQALKQ